VSRPENATALVTGASKGIGAAIARALAADGWNVAVNYRSDEEGANATVKAIEEAGGNAKAFHADVSNGAPDDLFKQVEEELGPVIALVNNAGVTADGLAIQMDDEAWDKVIGTNLTAAFRLTRRAMRPMIKARHGRIVNVASVVGPRANAGQSNYAAAKAGIASMTIVLARELQKYGVTVNAIAPRARTRLTATVAGADQMMSAKEGEFDAWHPDNMAPLIGFLAGDAAADVNGQVFVMWGESVYLMRGWSLANELKAGGKRWTVDDLTARKAELFAPVENGSAIPSMAFSM
jgi:3-oxoacyl-[acyl-carrier protein] reductase